MYVILLVLGILITGAGIVTLGFGISINELSLGNTLIVAGTTALSAGLVLIGLAAAVGQLTQIAQALRPRAPARPARPPEPIEQAPPAIVRPPARGPIPAKPKAEERVPTPPQPQPPAADPAPGVSASAIERLRSSLVRTERKAGEVTEPEDVPFSPGRGVQATEAGAGMGANGAAPPGGGGGAVEALKKPRLDFLFRSKPRDPQAESFDSVWPKRGSRHADDQANSNDPAKPAAREAPRSIERPWPPDQPPAPAPDEARPAAILKSGVVDGMAYTLYVDGSIEAQLPQGTVRFGSIAELRAHIENNS